MDTRDLKIETIDSAFEYNLKLIKAIDDIYTYVQQGNIDKGLELIISFFEGMEWLSTALMLASDIIKQKINILELNQKLIYIENALKDNDYFLVSDVLLYELKPSLEKLSIELNREINKA